MPAEPLVQLGNGEPYTVLWSDMAELFPETPGLPRPLSSLAPGGDAQVTHRTLERARRDGAEVHAREVEGKAVVSTFVRQGQTEVGVTAVHNPAGALEAVDIQVDWSAAATVLSQRWGEPRAVVSQDSPHPIGVWESTRWWAELRRVGPDMGMLHYRPAPEGESGLR